MDYYQLIHHGNINPDNLFWYKLCNCCPYGYHIDLDFVQYCNSLEHVDHTASMKRRKDRRRQRRSIVVLLGLDTMVYNQVSSKEEHVEQHSLDDIKECLTLDRSLVSNDGLNQAVLDFEQTLQNSKALDAYPHISKVDDHSNVNSPHLNMTMLPRSSKADQDPNSSSCGVIPADLQNIREQMALSLERTRIVEDLVKHIPLLQAQLSELKEEKRQLLMQIKMSKEENSLTNGEVFSNLSLTSPYRQMRDMTSHRKHFGTTCSLKSSTGNLDVSHLNAIERPVNKYADKQYEAKSNFLNNSTVKDFNNSLIANKKSDVIIVTKETQTTLPRTKKDVSTHTVDDKGFLHVNTIQGKPKLYRSIGMTACAHTTESSTEPIISVSTIGVSEDTIDGEPCFKCAYCISAIKSTSTNHLNTSQNRTLGCQYDQDVKNASVQCETKTYTENIRCVSTKHINVATNTDLLKKENRNISCQYECLTLHKACQIDLKLKDKAIQYDTPFETVNSEFCTNCNINKKTSSVDTSLNNEFSKIALSSLMVSRSKSFCSLDTSARRSISCQHESFNEEKAVQALPKVNHKAAQCEDASYFIKFKTKLGPKVVTSDDKNTTFEAISKKNSKINLKDENIAMQSRIPRLQITTENRKLKRQDTYNVDLSQSISVMAEKDLENGSELFMPENTEYEDKSVLSNLSPEAPSYSEAHLETLIERNKTIPSKSMRAALKVLSDCLKKGQTKNLENQLKNSINIVQLEWFKVSSLISSNPLDVEDYLDYFEDISFNLLRYIVNMIDTNGNTAMHYAVSHGNFDIVSILLDSKVCDINQANKVGYTSVMLVSLVEISSAGHANVVRRLFKLADVNVKAKQHGQTALMLAVSHGQLDMVQMLLDAGADINIQDEDGSTALMCAAEHGHIEIVELFLKQTECDSTIADMDGSTALTIAMEAGHRPIGVLLYAHQRIRKSSIQRSKSS